MNGPEIDHWIPEGHYPALAILCHNLVPVCHICNSPGYKRPQLPLTIDDANMFDAWFHPYERPICGAYSIEVRNSKQIALISTEVPARPR